MFLLVRHAIKASKPVSDSRAVICIDESSESKKKSASSSEFIELTNYTPELDTYSMSSVTLALELLRADP